MPMASVWLDRVGQGLSRRRTSLSAADREAAIRLLAHEAGEIVGEDRPALATILPDSRSARAGAAAAARRSARPRHSQASHRASTRSPTMCADGIATERAGRALLATPSRRSATSSSPAARARARRRCSTRCWPRAPSATRASSFWKTPPNCNAPAPNCGAAPDQAHRPAGHACAISCR